MRIARGFAVGLMSALSMGCGGNTEVGETSGTAGGAGGSGGTAGTGDAGGAGGGGGSGGAGGAAGCPSSPPGAGVACEPLPSGRAGLDLVAQCSWGDDPRPWCRTTATCSAEGMWVVDTPDPGPCAMPALPAACPEVPADNGTACDDKTLECWYPGGDRCRCSECQGGSEYPVCQTIDPPEWACGKPTRGCPSAPPQAGAACSPEGQSCGPSCELQIVCEGGVWVWRDGNCPICASADTPIATPFGERAIADLRAGDLVYSVDRDAIVAVPLVRAESTDVAGHRVLRVTLSSGAVLEMSPGHPTADGRPFAALRPGDAIDARHVVVSTEVVPYTHPRTHDILPASSSGSYFASGVQIGSSLSQ